MSVRDALIDSMAASADDADWRRKLASDAEQIELSMPSGLRTLHETVVERTQLAQAKALILSGSTVRGSRTEISDLDYHLVGPKIETKDLSRELDLHVLTADKLVAEILKGDDFIQWSLRFGCVVFDDGTVRQALRLLVEQRPWPDVGRKRAHAAKSLDLARRFVETGDVDGAVVQVRTALSLAARAQLLGAGVFPLSRAELLGQLETVGHPEAAEHLAATIFEAPSLAELATAVRHAEKLLAVSP